jgi:hypothetical protein
MTFEHLGQTAAMGPLLQIEVETQLLKDLSAYGINSKGLSIDWSDACQEGHCTSAIDGNLEELSGVAVIDSNGVPDAEGWIDFVHGGGNQPLFVFWLFLSIVRDDKWIKIKDKPNIPHHLWPAIPDSTKHACTTATTYDARWSNDPLVVEWKRAQRP